MENDGLPVSVSLSNLPHHLHAGATRKFATDRIKLGPMHVEVPRLKMESGISGTGGSSKQTRKPGVQGLADDLVTVFDSADQYGPLSQVKHSVKGLPRDKAELLTKTGGSTEEEMRADPDRFRCELNTDYLDILLLRVIEDADWPKQKRVAMAVIAEGRERGIVWTRATLCHTRAAVKDRGYKFLGSSALGAHRSGIGGLNAGPMSVLGVLTQRWRLART